jgi:hypothetical protein
MNQIDLQQAASAAQIATRVRRSLELGEAASELADARSAISGAAFVGLSILCVCAMVVASVLSVHDCRVKPIALVPGVDANVSILVPPRTPCTIVVQSGNAALRDLLVTVPPVHGTLTPRGRTGVIYQPNRGFRGDDAFAFSLQGSANVAGASALIRVRATVN